ncbi:MAG TPA: hypothetical protein GXZ90_02105 [Clostridiales bacterium]|nr:hypothetical protein [Clostridiales bacterium]
MREISDLTRDIRPNLGALLITSIHDTIEIDKCKSNEDTMLVEYENRTFYYRVIYLFMQRSILYYTSEEIEEWSKKELLKKIILPNI